MASILKRGDSYSVRYKYKDHSGNPCEGWESFKTRKEAQERKITVEKELLDGTFSPEHYTAVERALADLSEVPTDRLIGSDALAKVLRLAAIHGEARDRELRDLAASQVGAMGRAA